MYFYDRGSYCKICYCYTVQTYKELLAFLLHIFASFVHILDRFFWLNSTLSSHGSELRFSGQVRVPISLENAKF